MRKTATQAPKVVVPEIKVEPIVKVDIPKTDMQPIADALKAMQPPIKLSDETRVLEIEVTERDRSGAIKKLVCTDKSVIPTE